MTEINDLPDEVIEYILSKVPPYTDLKECQLVCKRWKILVENVLRYTRMNLNRGLADFRLCWKSLDAVETNCTIAGRFGHSAVVHEDSMYVFGGNSSTQTNFNDLWRFDLSKRRWSRLSSMSTYPSPKSAASIVCYRDHLVLFGGRRIVTLYHGWKSFDELHLYSIKTNKWTEQTLTNRPPPMAGHSASAHENKMVVFGGYQYNDGVYTNSNDIWCLDLVNFCWSKPSISELKPLPRYGQFQTALDDDNLLIVGGCGGPNNMFSDAWVLNMTGDMWTWRKVNVKNERFSGTHMWCNPACRVGNKLVVLGPTRSLPSDFQTIKQQMPQSINRLRPEIRREENPGWFRNLRQVDDVPINRHNNANRLRNDPININNNNNNNRNYNANMNNIINNNNNVNNEAAAIRINGILNRAANEDDAVSRLQKNLALRYRDDGMKLPKRFDEPFQDRFKLAAFNNDHEERRNDSRERQQERIRRMESKMQALQNSRRIAAGPKREESNTRVKKNCIAIFVCDISNVLATEPCMEWLEYKNYGIVSGAPERLVFSTIVHGNGELIMFGGVKKESLSDVKYQVSNTLYFLSAPRPVI